MSTSLPVIKIKANANQHAWFLILVGGIMAILTLLLSQHYGQDDRLVFIFLYLQALVIIIIGLFKCSEPKYSFYLTPQGIQYNHRYGTWNIEWQQIQNINIIRETFGLLSVDLPYIGIKLKNITPLADQISPRLANKLIHEQRPLLGFSFKHHLLSLEQTQLNFTSFTLQSGQIIKGPLAAFMHHSQALQSSMGYHLYLPETSIDREVTEFCQLLNQCMAASINYQE